MDSTRAAYLLDKVMDDLDHERNLVTGARDAATNKHNRLTEALYDLGQERYKSEELTVTVAGLEEDVAIARAEAKTMRNAVNDAIEQAGQNRAELDAVKEAKALLAINLGRAVQESMDVQVALAEAQAYSERVEAEAVARIEKLKDDHRKDAEYYDSVNDNLVQHRRQDRARTSALRARYKVAVNALREVRRYAYNITGSGSERVRQQLLALAGEA